MLVVQQGQGAPPPNSEDGTQEKNILLFRSGALVGVEEKEGTLKMNSVATTKVFTLDTSNTHLSEEFSGRSSQ